MFGIFQEVRRSPTDKSAKYKFRCPIMNRYMYPRSSNKNLTAEYKERASHITNAHFPANYYYDGRSFPRQPRVIFVTGTVATFKIKKIKYGNILTLRYGTVRTKCEIKKQRYHWSHTI